VTDVDGLPVRTAGGATIQLCLRRVAAQNTAAPATPATNTILRTLDTRHHSSRRKCRMDPIGDSMHSPQAVPVLNRQKY
jgi:hypothetical protein